jgi:hypothetical protein
VCCLPGCQRGGDYTAGKKGRQVQIGVVVDSYALRSASLLL